VDVAVEKDSRKCQNVSLLAGQTVMTRVLLDPALRPCLDDPVDLVALRGEVQARAEGFAEGGEEMATENESKEMALQRLVLLALREVLADRGETRPRTSSRRSAMFCGVGSRPCARHK
jgi:hypothetical protein